MKYSIIDEKILTYLVNCSLYFKTKDHRPKGYAFPLWRTILKVLEERYSLKICRRTLAYHLKFLKDEGYIEVRNRTHKGKHGNMVFTSCIFIPSPIAYQKLKLSYRDTRVVAFAGRAFLNRRARVNAKPPQEVVQKFKNKPAVQPDLINEDQSGLLKNMPVKQIRRMFTEAIKNLG